MTETKRITYINCGFCTAKNHCKSCGDELAQALARKAGIANAAINLPEHTLQVAHSLENDELEDLLDAMGLLVG